MSIPRRDVDFLPDSCAKVDKAMLVNILPLRPPVRGRPRRYQTTLAALAKLLRRIRGEGR